MTESLIDIARALYPFRYSIVSPDSDSAINVYKQFLDFAVHEYPSGASLNGWTVPKSWWVKKAEIRSGNDLIYDAKESPLGVAALSHPFRGSVSLRELKRHLTYCDSDPSAIPYHWRYLYRPDERDWMMCISREKFDNLAEGIYEVDLEIGTTDGTMKVLEATLPGMTEDTILLNAHNCHPWQANDDISGAAVGIGLMQSLSRRQDRHFTYRLVIAPELIGTAFWLDQQADKAQNIKSAIMLKAVGNDRALRLQSSFTGAADIDHVAQHIFEQRYQAFDSGPFRTIYGNDETVFEAPPYNIPSIALTRFPFAEYHTNFDTPDLLSENRLRDTLETAEQICIGLEQNIPFERNFDGLVCLSAYGLYLEYPADGATSRTSPETKRRWNLMMNSLPRYLDGKTPMIDIARRFDVQLSDLNAYLERWETAGLVYRRALKSEYQSKSLTQEN